MASVETGSATLFGNKIPEVLPVKMAWPVFSVKPAKAVFILRNGIARITRQPLFGVIMNRAVGLRLQKGSTGYQQDT